MAVCRRGKYKVRAFSLIEMSIVLVVVGLIVGGIIGGRELIKSAEIRGVVSKLDQYHIAINNFVDTYSGLPGDMPNAMDYWSTSCFDLPSRPCNGNGSGFVETGATLWTREPAKVWHHLGLANIIPNHYSGNEGGGPTHYEAGPGMSLPLGATKNSSILYREYQGSNVLMYLSNPTDWSGQGRLSGLEAYKVDKKMDDGDMLTGKIKARRFWMLASGCHTGVDNSAVYDLEDDSSESCVLMYPTSF